MHDFSENSVMGLGPRARNHLIRFSGRVNDRPFVEEIIDAHGEDAKVLIEVLKLEGKHGKVLDIEEAYAVENPERKDPKGNDWYLYKNHRHSEGT